MRSYMISYDLSKPGQQYQALFQRLVELGATRVLYSQWVLQTHTWIAEQIRNDLQRFIDSNDRLLVTGLTGEAAWTGLLITSDQFKAALVA